MAKKKHKNRKRDILLCIFVPIGILAFPFLLSLHLPYLRFFFFPFCDIQYPEFGDLLAFYGVVLSVFVSVMIYHWTKNDSDKLKEKIYLLKQVPCLGIVLSKHPDEDHVYRLSITNRRQTVYTIENICNESVNLTLTEAQSDEHDLFIYTLSPDKKPDMINVSMDSVNSIEQEYPKTLDMDIIDDNSNLWHCTYKRYTENNTSRYRLSSAIWTDKINIEKEC